MYLDIVERGKKLLFKLARYIPSVRDRINNELINVKDTFEKDVLCRLKETPFIVHLPENGLSDEKIIDLVRQFVNLGK